MHANHDWLEIPVIVPTAKDLTSAEKRTLSGRVEQILDKDSWSHEQLVGLVHKLVAGREANS
jgi:hypothetical protein